MLSERDKQFFYQLADLEDAIIPIDIAPRAVPAAPRNTGNIKKMKKTAISCRNLSLLFDYMMKTAIRHPGSL